MLSTMHHDEAIDTENKKKPEIIIFYNSTKGAVDTVDKMTKNYTVKRKCKRWPLVIEFNNIDIAGIAAYTSWVTRFPGWMEKRKDR